MEERRADLALILSFRQRAVDRDVRGFRRNLAESALAPALAGCGAIDLPPAPQNTDTEQHSRALYTARSPLALVAN